MDDSMFVGVVQRIGDCRTQPSRLLETGSMAGEPIGERHAADEIADDEQGLALAADLIYRHDVRVAELRRRTRLTEKLLYFRRRELSAARNLHGDNAIQLPIASFPNRAESTDTQSRHQVESVDRLERSRHPGRIFPVDQTEHAAASVATNVFEWGVSQKFDGIAAIGAANMQSPRVASVRRVLDGVRRIVYSRRHPNRSIAVAGACGA